MSTQAEPVFLRADQVVTGAGTTTEVQVHVGGGMTIGRRNVTFPIGRGDTGDFAKMAAAAAPPTKHPPRVGSYPSADYRCVHENVEALHEAGLLDRDETGRWPDDSAFNFIMPVAF